ncbi:MAG: NifU family protein [Crocinitomicaceae bacterium]|nr:NifU family protein [Crocinitomicaceae bacterium]
MSKIPVTIYAEMTPNPAVMKFVANNYLIDPSKQVEFTSAADAKGYSPLAEQLFQFPFVKSVFIASNFVSVTKNEALSWDYVLQDLRDFIRNYIADGNEIVIRIPEPKPVVQKDEAGNEDSSQPIAASEYDTIIENLLEEYVKPAVEGDGGAIEFRHFQDGIVTVLLKGACSGCPSSTATLKHGIENLLKSHLPEVKEVVAEQG